MTQEYQPKNSHLGVPNTSAPGLRWWLIAEVPSPPTREFLQLHDVDFIAGTVRKIDEAPPLPAPGALSLVRSQVVTSGDKSVRWRVWKVEKP